MTTAVLAPPSTRIERREPLATIGMAASQAQSRASASGKTRAPRRSTRNSANQQGLEEIANESKRKAGKFALFERRLFVFELSKEPEPR
jgi:kinetochore protein Mis13/DSN1